MKDVPTHLRPQRKPTARIKLQISIHKENRGTTEKFPSEEWKFGRNGKEKHVNDIVMRKKRHKIDKKESN